MPIACLASDFHPLLGGYVDTLNKLDLKVGVTYDLSNEIEIESDELPFDGSSFLYSDLEVGYEGKKIALGLGEYTHHGLDRIGLSYAYIQENNLIGIEAVSSNMGISLKVGYYSGLSDADDQFLFGLGIGF